MPSFEPLSYRILGAAFRTHNALGPGHLENVYQNALAILLQREGMNVRSEVRLVVHFEGRPVGHCEADLIVDDQIVVETKAKDAILPAHEARLGAYLRCSGYQVGVVLNFGPVRVDIRRVDRTREEKKRSG